ncbi:2869_t:CDS:10 [Acaulospora morrowiae]|uniref:2869_t:CDS:1 n=1 Tax=Acaulospora morrowiae TaxID=94023 RepID=A0A9N9ADY3_9GLOM|nr:2869_t:CDS:10 [Acaulospora morrowiae]
MDSVFRHHSPTEDCVFYYLYFPRSSDDSDDRFFEFLQETSALILSELDQFLNGYIWQKEPFGLRIVKNDLGPSYPFLHGRTVFGDCIEDERFIVFLLRQISEKYPDIVISVSDNDGEFLLIEAAMQLPSWLDPSNGENRVNVQAYLYSSVCLSVLSFVNLHINYHYQPQKVFIHRNELHIIPLMEPTDGELQVSTEKLTVERAIQLVRDDNIHTKADDEIQTTVFANIRGYPDVIKQNIHHARCHVPRSIAHLLYHNPQLIAPAVEAFYTRDPIALKACQKMEKFPVSTSINVTVKFTKVLYAQMVGQRFQPPKPFKLPHKTSNEYQAAELGMKLACGFEILCTDKYFAELQTKSDDLDIEKYPFDLDSSWRAFHANLLSRGYYRGEISGSKLYKQLDDVAKKQFLQNRSQPISTYDEIKVTSSPVEQINEILSRPLVPDELLTADKTQDDDSWLNVDPKQLEDLLEATKGHMGYMNYEKSKEGNSDDELNVFDLTNMIDKLESFMDDEVAGIEGAEFNDEHDSDEDFEDFGINGNNDQIQFEPTEFLRIMRQTLGITDEEYRELANAKIKLQQDELEQYAKDQSQYTTTGASQSAKITELTDDDMETYFEALDSELSSSKVYESFVRSPGQILGDSETDLGDDLNVKNDENNDSDEELNKPVDINLNLAKNILESFKSQEGLPGPVGNMLGRMGVGVIPVDSDDDDDYVESSDEDE